MGYMLCECLHGLWVLRGIQHVQIDYTPSSSIAFVYMFCQRKDISTGKP